MGTNVTPAEKVLGHLDAIPTLPSVVIRILEIVLDASSSARDAGEVVEVDQALTAKVLRIVNSPAYGFRRKITSVQHAISLLGFSSLKSIVLSVSVFDNLLDQHKAAALDKVLYWQHCLATAAAARAIARGTGYEEPDDAYLAGLLHDVGKVVIDRNAPEEYLKVAQRLKEEPVEAVVAEHQMLQTDHAVVGALLLERWHLPTQVVQAVRMHHSLGGGLRENALPVAEKLAAIVAAADFVVWTQGMGSVESLRPPLLEGRIRDLLSFDKLNLEEVTGEIERELTRTAEVFRIPVPDSQQLRKALQKANVELGKINSLYDEARRQLELRVKELTELNEAIRRARLTLDADEVRSTIVGVVHSGLGFDRASYFAVDWEGRWIAGRDVRDSSQIQPRQAEIFFALESEDNFLARCALEAAPFVLRVAHEKGLAARLLHYFDVTEIVIAPIFSRSYLTGLVLADNAFSGYPIAEASVQTLAILASEAGMAMENAMLFEKMRELAIRDELTTLFNRRHLMESLTYEMERARRYGRPLSVALLDVDHFKAWNDSFGHQAGDRVLKEVAGVIKSVSRDVDIVGRFGGEEFLVLLPETSIDHAARYAERLRVALAKRGDELGREFPGRPLTASIGLADYLFGRDKTRDQLLQRADRALYAAKAGGRNRVEVAVDAPPQPN